ncbi:MAG: putative maltokinase [Fibrobacteria bacterium]
MDLLDWNDTLQGKGKAHLEGTILPAFLPRCRWFGSKGRAIESVTIQDQVDPAGGGEWALLLLRVRYREGSGEEYLLPLARLQGAAAGGVYRNARKSILAASAAYESNGEPAAEFTILCEAVQVEDFRLRMLDLIAGGGSWPGRKGTLIAAPSSAPASRDPSALAPSRDSITGKPLASQVLNAEQSNTSIIFPGHYFVKFLRRLEAGENPESEILRFLYRETTFRNAPRFIGSLEYVPSPEEGPGNPGATPSEPYTIAIAEGLVAHESVAWEYALAMARSFANRLAARAGSASGGPLSGSAPAGPVEIRPDDPALAFARLLGGRTAEMHLALASRPEIPAFAPEPFTMAFQESLHAGMLAQVESIYALLEKAMPRLPEATIVLARRIRENRPRVEGAFRGLLTRPIPTVKTRVHGDYHLGQVLATGTDAVILDFEGEPARSLPERKLKRSPWKDVAGMLRSFHYAAHSAWAEAASGLDEAAKRALEPALEAWPEKACAAFLESYARTAGNAAFMPEAEDRETLLRVHLMEKAVYELGYELNNRPDWAHIPMLGILSLL